MAAAHSGILRHKRALWAKVAGVFSVVVITLYAAFDFEPVRNGGSWYGYTLGTIGALLIVWLAWLGIRKRRFNPGNWSLKAWTSAHVYLGLSLVIIGTLHTGFQFGWNIHTLTYGLMIFVILSGIFGIVVYTILPARMSDNRAETSQAEMLDELEGLSNLLRDTAMGLPDRDMQRAMILLGMSSLRAGPIARLRGRPRRCPNAEALSHFKTQLSEASDEQRVTLLDVISVLERRDQRLLRIRLHQKYKAMLDVWLFIHVPVTVLLLGALVAHIVAVFYYQ